MAAGFFEQDCEIDCRAAGTAVLGGQDEPEPAVFRKRFVSFARRPLLIVAALGVIRRADFIEQFAHVAAQCFLIVAE